jgi:alpha-glucoside transport system permease protein
MTGEDPGQGTLTEERTDAEAIGAGGLAGVAVLRIVASLAVPIIAFVGLWLTFEFLRDAEASRLVLALVAIVVGVAGVFALYWGMDLVVDLLPLRFRESVRPFVFVGPALVILTVFLVYPAINTTVISFMDAQSREFTGLDNYKFVFTDEGMLRSIRNTVGWIIVVPLFSVGIGLVFATLVDRLRRGEAIAKSMIFLPMAISFVGASIVWRFIYSFRPEGFGEQIGLLNGIVIGLGGDPVAWLSSDPWNNLLLMVIMIWLQTGFAMVILSAAIKAVPDDIIEAARIDGATEIQIFWRVIIPSIMSSIVVVTTTMVISVLKIFDIVWVMTNGQFGTEVIAERMVRWFFRNDHNGRGAAIAVILFLAIVPVMYINVRRFRAEEAIR